MEKIFMQDKSDVVHFSLQYIAQKQGIFTQNTSIVHKKKRGKNEKETFYQILTRHHREIQIATGDDDFDRRAYRACDTL